MRAGIEASGDIWIGVMCLPAVLYVPLIALKQSKSSEIRFGQYGHSLDLLCQIAICNVSQYEA